MILDTVAREESAVVGHHFGHAARHILPVVVGSPPSSSIFSSTSPDFSGQVLMAPMAELKPEQDEEELFHLLRFKL